MEYFQYVPQLGQWLWDFKGMCDQHDDNKKEMKELQSFIEDYNQHIPALEERFKEGGGNVLGIAVLRGLESDIKEAIDKLQKWSRNKNFLKVFTTAERMQKIEKLRKKVMQSIQKALGIAILSTVLDLQATHATMLDSFGHMQQSHAELKSFVISSIGSMQGKVPLRVRDEVVAASKSVFADEKFWADILAAVDSHCEASSSSVEGTNIYEDPLTASLMIDPVVCSDCHTYCRWTIIDNSVAKSPYNAKENLTIVIDNLTVRRGLFENFPGQFKAFQERRNEYRSRALSLKRKELLSDAALALRHILQWDKNDKECIAALEEVEEALKKAKGLYVQPSSTVVSNKLSIRRETRSKTHLISSPNNRHIVNFDKHNVDLCIKRLKSSKGKEQVQAVYKIRQWTSMGDPYQSYIAEQGIIPLLDKLSLSMHQPIQEHSTVALLQLAVSGNVTEWVAAADKSSLDALVSCLWKGSMEARERVAALLVDLSLREEVELSVKSRAAVIPALVALLRRGSAQGKKHAATALLRLCDYQGQVAESLLHCAVEYDVVLTLLDLVAEQPASAVLEESLAFLAILATNINRGRVAIKFRGSVRIWLNIIDYSGSSPLNQENAVAILHALCSDDPDYRQLARELNTIEYMTAVARSPVSTNCAKEKAKLLIQLLSWDPEAEENEEQDVFGLRKFFTDASTECLGNNRKEAKVDEDRDVYALTTLFKQDTSKMSWSKPRKLLSTEVKRCLLDF